MKVYEQAFLEYCLPRRIRTDNGYPFAMVTLRGLTPFTVLLIKLGIMPKRIAQCCPQQNGRHERMHCTLKTATASPPRGNLSAQQHAFDRFRYEYNEMRPHQNQGRGICSMDVHQFSPLPYPDTLEGIVYPDDLLVRKVRQGVFNKLNRYSFYITLQLTGENAGPKSLDHDC